MNINMRWKVMAQFLVAFLIIAIAGNIISSLVSEYFDIARGRVMDKTMVSLDPKEVDIKKLIVTLQEGGIKALNDPGVTKLIESGKCWVQVLDRYGNEVAKVNKPDSIQNTYTLDEITQLFDTSVNGDYSIYVIPDSAGRKADAVDNVKQKVITDIKSNSGKDDTTYVENEKADKASMLMMNSKFIYIIGMPRQKITYYNILYGIYDYLTQWTNPISMPKTITTALTLLLVLVLGYIFTRGITKPVVKITDGITSIGGGNYSVQYAEKGLYKQVYESLNNTVKALKSADIERKRVEQMREDWIVNLSHDMKTPLSSIKGYGQLLHKPDYEFTAEERMEFSEIILNKTAYMEMLLEDLKLTQQLKNGFMPIQKTSGNLVELLREIIIDILNDPKYADREIVFEPEEEIVQYEYDSILLQRAFTNIIYNAIVHNSEDTIVKVKIAVMDGLCVTVTDNGSGISKEDQKNLFERYYRGTNTEASTSGSGLGLAIARQVIEAHGGKIELTSEIGKGTTVKIMLIL